MAIRLRPPVAFFKDLREFTRWCTQAVEGAVADAQIDDNSITVGKLQQVATDTILGRDTAGTGNVEVLTATQARSAMGLGTAATQNTGTSGAKVPLLSGSNTHASVQATLFAVGSATPVGSQAANADTSGATLGQLETEVNELKAVLRTFGLIST